jgi:hypothetical protein
MRFLFLLFVLLCSSSLKAQTWSDSLKSSLRDTCMQQVKDILIAGPAEDYCSCYVDSVTQFEPTPGKAIPDSVLTGISSSCLDQLHKKYPGGIYKQKWTEERQKVFRESCMLRTSSKVTDKRIYCNCVLGKIMQVYPDPQTMPVLDEVELNRLSADCLDE